MRLAIEFPASWSVSTESDGRTCAIVPGHEGPPDLVIAVSAIDPMPPEFSQRNIVRYVGSGMSPKAALRIQEVGELTSAAKRPITMVRAGVHDADGALIEQRLAAIYDLDHYVATVLVIGRDAARWNALVRSLEDVVLGAVLEWSGQPTCLADILGIDGESPVFREPPSRAG